MEVITLIKEQFQSLFLQRQPFDSFILAILCHLTKETTFDYSSFFLYFLLIKQLFNSNNYNDNIRYRQEDNEHLFQNL